MDDKKAREAIAILGFRTLAMRDVVARLLAYEAQRWENPQDLFRDFAETSETRIANVTKKRGRPSVPAEEAIRKELDWILSAAQTMLPKGDR